MDEASVELLVRAQVPELEPVGVVNVGVAAEHLAVDVADVAGEGGGEAGGLAEPGVLGACGRVVEGWGWAGEGVGWEDARVGDLACDPALDVGDVLWGWDADRVLVGVEPGVGHAGTGGHGGACVLVADGKGGAAIAFLDHFEHAV